MIHPDTELQFIDEAKGFGVVAKRLIPRGTIVWCLDALDQVIAPDQARDLEPHYQDILNTYAFRDKDGNYVLCWDNGRFVNHSFRPNCLPTPYDIELAVRDIFPGEELVDHYGSLNLETPFRAMPEPGVRRRIAYPHDLQRHHRSWDRQLKQSFRNFRNVAQPLWVFVSETHQTAIADIVAGLREMDSCLETYCRPNQPEPALSDS